MRYLCSALLFCIGELLWKRKIDGEDTGTKNHALRELCGGRLVLWKYRNYGAFRNIGEKRSGLVAALSVLLTALLTVFFFCSLGSRGNTALRVGLTFLLGGAYSNTYERLRHGYVVDYLSVRSRGKLLGTTVFNLADLTIAIGALLIVLSADGGLIG